MKTKKKFNYKRLAKRAFSYISRALDDGKNLTQIKEDLREIVNSYEGLTKNERYDMYSAMYQVCRAGKSASRKDENGWKRVLGLNKNYDTVMNAIRRVKGSSELRGKRRATRMALQDEDTVFFLCSSHSNCAEGHKDLQGQIYVDRYWRTKVSGFDYYKVWSYIKNHDIMTVQASMQEPYYLITRPYCKHYLIPMSTAEVLGSSVRKLRDTYGMTYEEPYDYYAVRDEIYQSMNKAVPCSEFSKKNKRG